MGHFITNRIRLPRQERSVNVWPPKPGWDLVINWPFSRRCVLAFDDSRRISAPAAWGKSWGTWAAWRARRWAWRQRRRQRVGSRRRCCKLKWNEIIVKAGGRCSMKCHVIKVNKSLAHFLASFSYSKPARTNPWYEHLHRQQISSVTSRARSCKQIFA